MLFLLKWIVVYNHSLSLVRKLKSYKFSIVRYQLDKTQHTRAEIISIISYTIFQLIVTLIVNLTKISEIVH